MQLVKFALGNLSDLASGLSKFWICKLSWDLVGLLPKFLSCHRLNKIEFLLIIGDDSNLTHRECSFSECNVDVAWGLWLGRMAAAK